MLRLDHVQLAIPRGAEEACRGFYAGLLGMAEVPKPDALAARGGLWLKKGAVRIHLGVEEDFRPARKAHPAIAVEDLDVLADRLVRSGVTPLWDDALPGVRRFHVSDPVGNRMEFMAA
jgi:catechol 2,3-dioxygenase-like lactoylglutathione lyase family enzyme